MFISIILCIGNFSHLHTKERNEREEGTKKDINKKERKKEERKKERKKERHLERIGNIESKIANYFG